MNGTVYLIGTGIRKSHLTFEAQRTLRKCDAVLYDRLVDEEILEGFVGEKVYVGKKPGESRKQGRINMLLLKLAMQGKTVARLKGGDPFLFSRGFEEFDYLKKKGVDVKAIPGVSAFQALSELGIPLTYRGGSSSVAFITGVKASKSQDYGGLCADTLVFYMPVGNLGKIVGRLRKHKKKAHCMLIENAGKENYRIISGGLDNILEFAKEANVTPPTLFVVSPYKRRLYAKKVLTFRQVSREAETIRNLKGFKVVNYPLYSVKHRKIKKPAARVYAFTSPNAVESVFIQYKLTGKFIAIGEKTAEALKKQGVKASIPKTQSSTGLMKHLKQYNKKDTIVFCSPHTRVKDYRKTYAYDIKYKKRAPGLTKHVRETDALVITSSEILNTLCNLVSVDILNTKTVVVIGPKTAATAKNAGLHVDHTLEKPLIEELVKLR